MPSGGARNRSGPPPDPQAGRSERRGLVLTALPREGFTGVVPEFPLPAATGRELDVWAEAWRTPQAAAWADQPWRLPIIGEYVRLKVLCEKAEPNASLIGQLHRYRDQLGLTPAGLRENGWAIAADEVAARRDRPTPTEPPSRRLRAASDGGA